MNNKRWTEEELQYLLNNIKDKPDVLFEKFSIEFENLRTYSAFKEKRTQLIRKYNDVDIDIKKVDPKKVAYRERIIQRARANNRNERLKDFNELIPNKDYSFKNIGPRKWKQGKYLYMNEYSIYFRTKYGFVETLPRNRNLIHIKDNETGQPVCRHIKLSSIDRA